MQYKEDRSTYASNTIYYEIYGIAPTIVHMLYKKNISGTAEKEYTSI